MQTPNDLVQESWFRYLSPSQQQLMQTSLLLLEQAETDFLAPDYGYIIFSAAKAYEGLLKKYLLDTDLIDRQTYGDRRLRIGRALNPDVRHSHRDEYWLYDDVSRLCGEGMAAQIWQTWLDCRNHIFHFFPEQEETISLSEARRRVEQIIETLQALVACYDQNNKERHD